MEERDCLRSQYNWEGEQLIDSRRNAGKKMFTWKDKSKVLKNQEYTFWECLFSGKRGREREKKMKSLENRKFCL